MELPLAEIFERPETSASKLVHDAGFSESLIDRFFRPFFGSIFLDSKLHASSRMFEFIFRMLAEGEVALPAKGMGAIPTQIAGRLPERSIRLGAKVDYVSPDLVGLESGEELRARRVVVATEGPEAARLTGAFPAPASRPATCVYYAAPEPPVADPILVLNGNNKWPINNACVLSQVAPEYAPQGRSLVSITVLGSNISSDAELEPVVRRQLLRWFGRGVKDWQPLGIYRIPHAQPDQVPPGIPVEQLPVRVSPGLYVCGDHRDNASINGALVSGRRAAEAILEDS
jgi:phytoene dehydrogenase-like protein